MIERAPLARITIYPIKSLDGLSVSRVEVLPKGGLSHDRRWALVDREGQPVNGKRCAKIHLIAAKFDEAIQNVQLSLRGDATAGCTFSLADDAQPLAAWISEKLGIACRLIEDRGGGFPDDRQAPGPTVISTATLSTVADWFDGLGVDDVRRRFRANLEVGAEVPFWEDRLLGEQEGGTPFRIGSVRFLATGACQRCPVPTRSPDSGQPWPQFVSRFRQMRASTLPRDVRRTAFDHFYRLAINTRLARPAVGGRLEVGDFAAANDAKASDDDS